MDEWWGRRIADGVWSGIRDVIAGQARSHKDQVDPVGAGLTREVDSSLAEQPRQPFDEGCRLREIETRQQARIVRP